jgi:hypothetical protein
MSNEMQTLKPQTQSKEVAKIAGAGSFAFTPQNYAEAKQYATMVAGTDLCPAAYKGKPDAILVAWQYGSELGLKPMQALQGIAVINGRPAIWGDAMLAVVQSSGLVESFKETDDGKTATCTIKRKGNPEPIVRSFSMDDAKTAGLAGKQGPWTNYPARMRQMRARAFALRDGFADVLRGIACAEEVSDYEVLAQVDERTEVVRELPSPRLARTDSSASTQPAQKNDGGDSRSPSSDLPAPAESAALPAFDFKPTKVTKSGDYINVYDGETRYTTKHEGVGALAKAAKEGKKRYVGTYEEGADGREILEARVVEAA